MAQFSIKNDPFWQRETAKYAKPIPSREYISKCLQALGKPTKFDKIATAFGLRDVEKKEALRRRLGAMVRDGQLFVNRRGAFALIEQMSLVHGSVMAHREGYGFLIPEDDSPDVFLPARQMRSLFHGDRVLARVVKDRKQRLEGVVVDVLERHTNQIVGRFWREGGVAFVASASKNINQDVIIPMGKEGKAKTGQVVVARIVSFPTQRRQATGEIVEILGKHMDPGMEIEIIIRAYGLPYQWPKDVEKQLAKLDSRLRGNDESKKGREDLRHLPLVTIDGEDARDFDDAVYCEKRPKGGWNVYVAIADVSYYVTPDNPLDHNALLRGNSVYFPNTVIPMLPELLSNDLCSLKPNVDRLCLVCQMHITQEGKIGRYQFYPAIMNSKARLTYTEVYAVLLGQKSSKLTQHLHNLYALYKALQKQREKRGAIEFETAETRIIFDKNKKIQKILPVTRNDAHRIIEECMLAANVCAAKLLSKNKLPALYRVHEGPDAEKLADLRSFLSGLGLKAQLPDKPKPQDYANILRLSKNRPDKHLIQTMLLRSMRQAVYDAENVGHFGLAYEVYGHFTSPIRRFPDLITHRAIKHIIVGGKIEDFYYTNKTIHNIGKHCSMTERRADDATFEAVDWLKCEYMLDKVGKKFPGIISGVCEFGIFVELKEIYIEGLVHITALPNDYYDYNAMRHSLRGKRSGKQYHLGDEVSVIVARVDLDERKIDFELAS